VAGAEAGAEGPDSSDSNPSVGAQLLATVVNAVVTVISVERVVDVDADVHCSHCCCCCCYFQSPITSLDSVTGTETGTAIAIASTATGGKARRLVGSDSFYSVVDDKQQTSAATTPSAIATATAISPAMLYQQQ